MVPTEGYQWLPDRSVSITIPVISTLDCATGMVSVCAGCDGYLPWAAALVSCLAAILYLILARMLLRLGVDDPVDAVAIHAGGGILGVIAAPIFMESGKISLNNSIFTFGYSG